MKNKILLYLLLILYGFIGYSPYFGAIDQIGPQWLELSILNCISILYFQFSVKSKENFKFLFSGLKSTILICLISFCVWGFISYLYALNTSEVIIKTSQWMNVIISIPILYVIFARLKINFYQISVLLSFFLLIEVFFSMKEFLKLIEVRNYDFSLANYIKGLTGNKNITSASIATKIPFLIYLILNSKKQFYVFIGSIILFVTYIDLIFLSSRAVYVSILTINILIFIFFFIYLKLDIKKVKIQLSKILITQTLLIVSILFSILYLGIDNSAAITKRIQTINLNDESTSQRLRFYGHAIDQSINNIFIGTGLGNWKIKSIDYDSLNMSSYIVPYHVHNDFLEIMTELGLIGLILYLTPFLIVPLYYFKNIRSKFSLEFFIICLSLLIYFVDANLNFPHARVINQICFAFIISSFLILKKYSTK